MHAYPASPAKHRRILRGCDPEKPAVPVGVVNQASTTSCRYERGERRETETLIYYEGGKFKKKVNLDVSFLQKIVKRQKIEINRKENEYTDRDIGITVDAIF